MRAALVIGAGLVCANFAMGQQPAVPAAASGAPTSQSAMPRSGALLALDSGQTIWIAPVNGKMQVIATNDYVIPRKDGFWRVRLEFRELPNTKQQSPTGGSSEESAGVTPRQLWAVPLKKGKDAVAWDAKPKEPKDSDDSDSQEQKQSDQDAPMAEDDQPQRDELHFLSPEHLSFYTVTGEYSEVYNLLKIEDVPAAENGDMPALRVTDEGPPISEEQRTKDLKACADPNEELSTEDFLTGATEVSYGIVRGRGAWEYAWLLGYSGGAARGYHTGCYVSVAPPKSMVGYNEVYPAWDAIKDAFPDAEDVFSSPGHDMILVLYQNRLMAAPVQGGKVGRAVARLEVIGKPVMVQWALGKYVDVWTKELTPYFGEYRAKAKTEP